MTLRYRHPRRHNEAHLDFVRSLPCCICGDDTATEAAHLRASNLTYGKRSSGLQEKPDDIWVNPLCGKHHREQHSAREEKFWTNYGLDPWRLALSLYASSGDSEMAYAILERQGRNGSGVG